jgi:hypothetical protein
MGRIYEVRGGPEHLRWFWALHFPSKPESLLGVVPPKPAAAKLKTSEACTLEYSRARHASSTTPREKSRPQPANSSRNTGPAVEQLPAPQSSL